MARKRKSQQPDNENVWINSITRRKDWDKKPVNVKASTLKRYRATVKRLNAQYEQQKLKMIEGLDFLDRELKIMEYGLGYQIADISKKVRTEDELQELLARLKKHTVAQTNRRFRDNYVAALEKNGFPKPFINKIKKMGGAKFFQIYTSIHNVTIGFLYTANDSESEDDMGRIIDTWNEGIKNFSR